jgi:hypothetical protein
VIYFVEYLCYLFLLLQLCNACWLYSPTVSLCYFKNELSDESKKKWRCYQFWSTMSLALSLISGEFCLVESTCPYQFSLWSEQSSKIKFKGFVPHALRVTSPCGECRSN